MARRELSSTLKNLKVKQQYKLALISFINSVYQLLSINLGRTTWYLNYVLVKFIWGSLVFICMRNLEAKDLIWAYSFLYLNSSCKGQLRERKIARKRKRLNLMGISFLLAPLVESGSFLSFFLILYNLIKNSVHFCSFKFHVLFLIFIVHKPPLFCVP